MLKLTKNKILKSTIFLASISVLTLTSNQACASASVETETARAATMTPSGTYSDVYKIASEMTAEGITFTNSFSFPIYVTGLLSAVDLKDTAAPLVSGFFEGSVAASASQEHPSLIYPGRSRSFLFDSTVPEAGYIVGMVKIQDSLYQYSFFKPTVVPHFLRPLIGWEKKENGMVLQARAIAD